MAFWRITSWSRRNLLLAAEAGEWGAQSTKTLTGMEAGDGAIFYCSRGRYRGYWAYGTVIRELFTSSRKIWMDGDYPFRIGVKLESPILDEPVSHTEVLKVLKQEKLKYHRWSGVIRLTDREFNTMTKLIDRDLRKVPV